MTPKIPCKYHPQSPARRSCPQCRINFCARCARPDAPHTEVYHCPICKGELNSLGIGNTIVPFWERIPKFFAYPLQTDALIYILALSVASLIGAVPFFLANLIFLAILFAIIKYAYKCLNHTARGNLSPPGVLVNYAEQGNALPLKQVGIVILMFMMAGFAARADQTLGIVVLLFVLLSLPATAMILAIEGSFFKALNPLKWFALMTSVGKSYLVLYVFLLLLSGGSGLVQEFLASIIPSFLLIMFATFVYAYFTLVMFNMMGYLIYQYHEELGFEDVKEFNEDSEETGSGEEVDPLQNELTILLNEGEAEKAKTLLRKHLHPGSPLELHERYHKLLQITGDGEALIAHGEEFIRRLLIENRQKNLARAMGVYADCLKLVPDYVYPNANDALAMAEMANRWGKHEDSLRMLNKFAKRYPNSSAIPRAYFLAAKIMSEKKHQDAQARKILTSLLKQYPKSEIIPEVREYLKLLDKVGQFNS